jgi:N-acetylglucosamine malate deacetylase 1
VNSPLEYVRAFARLRRAGEGMAPCAAELPSLAGLPPGAPSALMLSPHPDDECIVGALALRLRREAGMRVVNLPMTFGSDPSRRARRREELQAACAFLGFELDARVGLDGVRTAEEVAECLREHRPALVFYPHGEDWNATHVRVHRLAKEGLAKAGIDCATAETEYWRPMAAPNAMVESLAEDVARLVGALLLHRGEVARNPYHLRLPAWMMDNVRRGAEVVLGQGGEAPAFEFATLYRVSGGTAGAVSASQSVAGFLETPATLRRG